MEQIKQLNLTEKDFQLLVDGLDALPEKGAAGSMMVDLIGAAMLKDEDRPEFERKRKAESEKRERERKNMMDDIRILQGKLLILKRHLITENLMSEVNDSLSK